MRYPISQQTVSSIRIVTLAAMLFSCTFHVSGIAADIPALKNPVPNQPVRSRQLVKDIDPATRNSIEQRYGKLPLSFEMNRGQADDRVKFLSRGSGYTLFLTPTEVVLNLHHNPAEDQNGALRGRLKDTFRDEIRPMAGDVIRLGVVDANANPKITGVEELPGKSNYFIGRDPSKWRKGISNFAKVKMEDVYPGIDLVYYGNQQQLEYDWIVKPGANPGLIRFAVKGSIHLEIDTQGNLLLDEQGDLRLSKPFIYQQQAGSQVEIAGSFILLGKGEVGFRLSQYDASLPLVIDPILRYSTYLGGSSTDTGTAIALDASGNAYVTGATESYDFPTLNPFQIGSWDRNVFVAKLNAAGTALIYSTYLGGSVSDWSNAIALDASGNAYVTGYTFSSDFPTAYSFQSSSGGYEDTFVTKLNASGDSLAYSTYLGGEGADEGTGIAVDASGNAYVTGYTDSSNFPTAMPLQAGYGGTADAFAAKLNASGNAMVYSTYLGGSEYDMGYGISVDALGNAYVVGQTNSSNFPTKNPLQASTGGGIGSPMDAFVVKLNASGGEFLYSTYLGGEGADSGRGIAVDASGNTYITGITNSAGFPTANAYQEIFGGEADAFVAKLNAAGNALIYSTYLGGENEEIGNGIVVDASGNAYVTGRTRSTDFPTVNPSKAYLGGYLDAFVAKLDSSGTAPIYSTYLGGSGEDEGAGIAVDAAGNAFVTGGTHSDDFPTSNPYQEGFPWGGDAFVTKMGISTTFGDVDSDGKTDLTVWRPDVGVWFSMPSSSPTEATVSQWGTSEDYVIPGDYDGDGKSDLAVWRPSAGMWFILPSIAPGSYTATQWGDSSDIPVPGDYDGDGKDDLAVFRPSAGAWFVIGSGSPIDPTVTRWGADGDIPVPGDYDGDGKTDIAVWRPGAGMWFIRPSQTPGDFTIMEWGISSDIPTPGDYDGDGKIDIAVWRRDAGMWFIKPSGAPDNDLVTQWGSAEDMPVAADYDGDGKADIAVWRPSVGMWFVRQSASPGSSIVTQWGADTDVAISPLTGIMRVIP